MARTKIDKDTRKALRNARKMIENVAKADGNEAETRRRVERLFGTLMGYDVFKHISREHAVGGTGTTEYCDFAVQIDQGESGKPVIMIELKRINIDLAPKHLKQVSSYAINQGCEWIVLTNGKEWRLYHVTFGQPPRTKLLHSWDLLEDDYDELAEKFQIIGYRNVKKGGLDDLWQKANVLTPRNLLSVLVSEPSIKLIRRELKKSTDVLVTPEDIVGAIRRMLNEAALSELENVKISLPARKPRRKRKIKTESSSDVRPDSDLKSVDPSDTSSPDDSISPTLLY